MRMTIQSAEASGAIPRWMRFPTQIALLIPAVWSLDTAGHIFVDHDVGYWVYLIFALCLITGWNEVLTIGERPVETLRTRIFRILYQMILLFLALVILDRGVDGIFKEGRTVGYWLVVAGIGTLLAGWYDLALTHAGQRILASVGLERFTLVVFSLAFSLALLELVVHSPFSRYHLFGIWPTWEITTDPPIAFQLNSMGFRDVEHNLEPEPGVTRVLLIGDSVTAGYAVSQTDYYPAKLREAAGPSVEFIVAAQPAAETVHELEFLEAGCAYAPDVVVVGVFSNDPYLGLERNTPAWPPQYDYFKKLESPYSYNPDLIYFFDSIINQTAGNAFGQYSYSDWLDVLYDPEQPWIDLWKPIVRQMAERATECGARQLFAFTLPEPADYASPEVRAKFETIHRVLADGFTEAGFETVNLFDAYIATFGERPYRSLWAIPNDPHPNSEIHSWYAEQIWSVLRRHIPIDG